MLSPDTAASLNTCANTGSGCFADHPDELDWVQNGVGDAGIVAKRHRMVTAVVNAVRAGTPLDSVTYPDIIIETRPDAAGFQLAEGEPVAIDGAAIVDRPGYLKCAGICAAAALCPLLSERVEQ